MKPTRLVGFHFTVGELFSYPTDNQLSRLRSSERLVRKTSCQDRTTGLVEKSSDMELHVAFFSFGLRWIPFHLVDGRLSWSLGYELSCGTCRNRLLECIKLPILPTTWTLLRQNQVFRFFFSERFLYKGGNIPILSSLSTSVIIYFLYQDEAHYSLYMPPIYSRKCRWGSSHREPRSGGRI